MLSVCARSPIPRRLGQANSLQAATSCAFLDAEFSGNFRQRDRSCQIGSHTLAQLYASRLTILVEKVAPCHRVQVATDASGQMMTATIRRAQRPYRSLWGTAGIPRAFVEWDKKQWAKRQARALKEQAAEQPPEEGEEEG